MSFYTQQSRVDRSHATLYWAGSNLVGVQATQAVGRTKGGIDTKVAAIVHARGWGWDFASRLGLTATTGPSSHFWLRCLASMRPPIAASMPTPFHLTPRLHGACFPIRPKRGRAERHRFDPG
jgi:hypothetical protein